jgi:hypothetical protein
MCSNIETSRIFQVRKCPSPDTRLLRPNREALSSLASRLIADESPMNHEWSVAFIRPRDSFPHPDLCLYKLVFVSFIF